MAIGATTAALPVFTKFDNIAFSSGTGSQLLSIKSANLYLMSSGCTFDKNSAHDHQQRAAGGQRHRQTGRDRGRYSAARPARQHHDM